MCTIIIIFALSARQVLSISCYRCSFPDPAGGSFLMRKMSTWYLHRSPRSPLHTVHIQELGSQFYSREHVTKTPERSETADFRPRPAKLLVGSVRRERDRAWASVQCLGHVDLRRAQVRLGSTAAEHQHGSALPGQSGCGGPGWQAAERVPRADPFLCDRLDSLPL